MLGNTPEEEKESSAGHRLPKAVGRCVEGGAKEIRPGRGGCLGHGGLGGAVRFVSSEHVKHQDMAKKAELPAIAEAVPPDEGDARSQSLPSSWTCCLPANLINVEVLISFEFCLLQQLFSSFADHLELA
ncbi:hypothetical protein HYQ46_009526 [Verticillium longisporum]|nr:hypothetical protein HYQ46_009526 [Verticillium longisporum]